MCLLTYCTQVFQHNAWDNVKWEEDQRRDAEGKVKENSQEPVPDALREEYEMDAASYWDSFYQQHQNRFFKDRHWLFTEFPELSSSGPAGDRKTTVWEVGCGAGNTVFPLLQTNKNAELFVYCSDFSQSAVELVQENSLYSEGRCHAFQCDITAPSPTPFPPSSLDVITLIFVLSALHPTKMQAAVNWLCSFLRPGGLLLFRDYGRYDMAQLRFKKGRCLGDNFYVRGDGTRVYFFTDSEVDRLMAGAGMEQRQLYVDRRLQVNRGRQVKMYRVWVQAKYERATSRSVTDSQPS
jgi:SAM-dependent methyltransferase